MTGVNASRIDRNCNDRCGNPRRGARCDLDHRRGVVAADDRRSCRRRRGVAVSGPDADPGTNPGVRAENPGNLRYPVACATIYGGLAAQSHDADIVANHRRLMHYARVMRIDVSLLPALAAAFMLAFARIGAMVMLLPGLGETNIPTRMKLGIALLLTLVILPLHRAAYHIDMQSITPLLVLMLHEIVIGVVLGATARVTLSALQVAGSVIAQQLRLGFVTAIDPTQGQQGLLIGNFLTILGLTLLFATDSQHLVISALNESYRIFSPGEIFSSGDVASLATRAFATAFKIGLQLSAPFLVFGLVFNVGLGVLARLMPQMQVYFVGAPLSILAGFLIFAAVLAAMMGTFLDYFTGVMHDMTPLK